MQGGMKLILLTALVTFCSILSRAQQEPDTLFDYQIAVPTFLKETGPVVAIDEGHHNFHTKDGRYSAFSKLLQKDGYRLRSLSDTLITDVSLIGIDVLVISNPLHVSNTQDWILPTPSAYSESEILTIRNWVAKGGRLFLIADHMPFAGAAEKLGEAFGIKFVNGFAMDNRERRLEEFVCDKGLVCQNEITDLKGDTIVTFTGSAFSIEQKHQPILIFDNTYTVLIPEVAWEFKDDTPYVSGEGLEQIAAMEYGKGRLIISGEAAMFSAQVAGPNRLPVGFNVPAAEDNCAFLLDLLSWLVGK